MKASLPASTPKRRRAQAWTRFRSHRRGWVSLWLLVALYGLSLAAELVCNDKPLLMRYEGHTFFPAFSAYTQNDILKNGVHTRMTDYQQFISENSNGLGWRLMAPFKSGAQQTFTAADIETYRQFKITRSPFTHTAAVQLAFDDTPHFAFGDTNYFATTIAELSETSKTSPALADAIALRLANKKAPSVDSPFDQGTLALAPFTPRTAPPQSVRVMLRSIERIKPAKTKGYQNHVTAAVSAWQGLSASDVSNVLAAVQLAKTEEWIAPVLIFGNQTTNAIADVTVELEPVSWPFRPVPGHPMGFDTAGHDVFARLFYALRTSMTFGLVLVCVTMFLGIIAGAVQGYFAGWVDITGQRITEIWSALPFLYIMILLGNTLGRSFGLLLFCYAIFNWIGIAAYIRAEFLRLRTRAFVDAARSQGLSEMRIMFRHILPNALTPLITLFPFALVGAIGSLAVLDYLGFGLPAGSPSWGELLNQAQAFRSAWWLILYPSLALFTVMLLGVFIGEGLRDALDPRPYSKME